MVSVKCGPEWDESTWDVLHGGCLTILRSKDPNDLVAVIPPVIGSSSVLDLSASSWHAVSRVARGCARSRRSMTVTFYQPGSKSTMWPEGETPNLHRYLEPL